MDSQREVNSIISKKLETYLKKSTRMSQESVLEFSEIQNSLNTLITQNESIKTKNKEFDSKIDRLLNHTLIDMRESLVESKKNADETDQMVQEALDEIEKKNRTIDSYSQEALQIQEENDKQLISVMKFKNDRRKEERKLNNLMEIFVESIQTLKQLLSGDSKGLDLQPNPEVIKKENELKKKINIYQDMKNTNLQLTLTNQLMKEECKRLVSEVERMNILTSSQLKKDSIELDTDYSTDSYNSGTKQRVSIKTRSLDDSSMLDQTILQSLEKRRDIVARDVHRFERNLAVQKSININKRSGWCIILLISVVLNLLLVGSFLYKFFK
ncbi:unnamed protein product [Moneuplotes crassus]|uniref:Uncharacterized protein n=2 Tax=Euplotes crassus TaxID=5936 RepID=A0AAD1XJH7_EUPCR|nr:unnamed protein product [Moneuplotes crassus]